MAICFIHIPRTGGNTLRKYVPLSNFRYIGHDLRSKRYSHPSGRCKPGDLVFTFVRNPFDRLVSAFFYLREGGISEQDALDGYMLGLRVLSFKEFVMNRLKEAAKWQLHFLPQVYYLNDVPNPKIFKTEHLYREFPDILQMFGIENQEISFERVNQSPRQHDYKQYFTPEMIGIVRMVYAEDFKSLGYSDSIPL